MMLKSLPQSTDYVIQEKPRYLTQIKKAPLISDDQRAQDNGKIYEKMNNDDEKNAKLSVDSANNTQRISINKTISVINKSGVVEKMPLEDYVSGCLLGEMPLSFHPQALMAQSVAIRSFTVHKILCGSKHNNAVACMNPACCQNFIEAKSSGYDSDTLEKAYSAVNTTKNVTAVYDGTAINAVYHAASANKTKDSMQVWGGKVDYLKSVDSPKGEAQICQSTYNGSSGHGVGMSQQGANLLALEGYSYIDILKYYYSGISFEMLEYRDV
ncbi:MAG: SpoIID/LytB domain-containing protein [Clostridia bacterium]|nr:SpoIID/LytB domain-containing protein [Clostridia bacterium]